MNKSSPAPERCSPCRTRRRLLSGLLLFAVTLLLPQAIFAAVAFRAATSASAASGSISTITATSGAFAERTSCGSVTPSIPAGNVGDLLIAQVIARRNDSTVTMSGWNTLFSDNVAGADYQVFLFWRSATGTDPNTVSQSGTCEHLMARITRFGNVDTAQPLETQPLLASNWAYANAGDVDTGTQNISAANSMLVLATFVADNRNVTQDTTFTQLYDNDDSSGADAGFSLNYRIDATTGVKGPFLNMDLSGNGSTPNHGVLFAVRPAPGGGTELTINRPALAITGDVLVASIAVTPDTVAIIPPSGWTVVQNTVQAQDAGSHLTTYFRVATGSEPANYTWSFSTSHSGAVGGIAAFSGVDTANPIVSSASLTENDNNAVNHTAPSITANPDDMLVTAHEYQSSGTWTPPGGMNEAVDRYSAASPNAGGISLEINYLPLSSAGATGDKVATVSNNGDEGASQSLALKTAPLTCFTDNFNRADGPPAGNWVVANEGGTFGSPRIVSQRLRLTNASTTVSTMAALQQLFPGAGNKIVVEFDHFAYNGSGADGMCIVLSDASIAPVPGAFGGSLGYAPKQASAGGDTTHPGFAGGWLGVALDEYGNFSNPTEGRTGGPGFRPDSAAIRGSGSLYTGYAYLAGTTTLSPGIDNAGSATAAPGYRYRITIDHTDNIHAYTSVERDTGSGYASLIAPFDAKAAAGQAAVPANWFLSFTGSTGASVNIHEVDNLRVCSTQPQPLPTLNHVRILHDGCAHAGVAETITLKACADAGCTALYLGPVTVNLSTIAGATWSADPVTFSGGQTTVMLTKSTADTVTLGGTVTSPAATNATAICYSGATQTCTLSSTCFDAVEVSRPAATPIHTKLAGTAFSLDVLATATDFTGPVSVALVDPFAPSGNCSDSGTGLTAEGAYSFIIGDNGRHTFNFNYPHAAKNVKVRIRDMIANQSVCSSDNFAIRPQQFSLSTTTPLTPASNILKAGADFNLTAAAGVASGYTGTPATDPAKIVDHNNAAIGAGTLSGGFAAATGTSSAGTFQYLDVGTITLNADAVLDATFAAVDQVTGVVNGVDHGAGDCLVNSTSNTQASGLYGCNIGSSTLGPLGRFYPDHYEVTANLTAACNGFTYMNQPALGVSLSIQALATGGTTPLSRYTNGYAHLAAFNVTGDNNGTPIAPLNNRLTPDLPAFQWTGGAYAGSGAYSFDRAANPDGPFDNFKLKVTVADSDGAQITRLNGNPIPGVGFEFSPATKIRYGRLRLPNAFGPETAPLAMALRAEYFNGAGFVTNTLDNCTSLPLATRIFLRNPATAGGAEQPGTTAMTIGTATTSATMAHTPFASGEAGLSFSAPGTGNVGFVEVRADVSAFPWLQIDWDNNGSLDANLNARANFGIYRGNDRIINWREIIR